MNRLLLPYTDTASAFFERFIMTNNYEIMDANVTIYDKLVYLENENYKIFLGIIPKSVAELLSEKVIRLFSWRFNEKDVELTFKRNGADKYIE